MNWLRYNLRQVLLLLALLGTVLLQSAAVSAATDPYASIDCSGSAATSVVCRKTSGDPISGTNGILHRVTRLLALIAGSVAIIIIILAGIRYITSNGDSETVAKSKRTIIFAAIGLIFIVIGQALITLVLNRVT